MPTVFAGMPRDSGMFASVEAGEGSGSSPVTSRMMRSVASLMRPSSSWSTSPVPGRMPRVLTRSPASGASSAWDRASPLRDTTPAKWERASLRARADVERNSKRNRALEAMEFTLVPPSMVPALIVMGVPSEPSRGMVS